MNWGTKLVIGMVLFMAFIVTLVILMIGPHHSDALIENDYYEKGQSFDADFNARQAAVKDTMIPSITSDSSGLTIKFPQVVSYEILFRRLADAKLDQTFKSETLSAHFFIPAKALRPGSWLLTIRYQTPGKSYLFQDKILRR